MPKPKVKHEVKITRQILGWASQPMIDAIKELAPRLSDEKICNALHFLREEMLSQMFSADPTGLEWMRMCNAMDSLSKQEREAKDFAVRQKIIEAGGDGMISLAWVDGTPMTPEQIMPGLIRRLLTQHTEYETIDDEECVDEVEID